MRHFIMDKNTPVIIIYLSLPPGLESKAPSAAPSLERHKRLQVKTSFKWPVKSHVVQDC